MKYGKIAVLLIFAVFMTTISAAQTFSNQETVRVHHGDSLELDDYIFIYDTRSTEDGQYFQINLDKEDSDLILEQVEDVYGSEGETFYVSDRNLSVEITHIGRDSDGRYLNLTIGSENNIFASAELKDSAPDRVIVSKGGNVEIPLTVKNTGLVDQSFNLSAVENTSMTTRFNFQGFNVSSIDVSPGEQKSVTAKIRVPEDTQVGEYKVDILAAGETRISRSIDIEVRGQQIKREREIDISIREMYLQANPGETLTIPIELRNRGNAPLNNIGLETSAPTGWEKTVTPKKADLEERYEERTIMVELEVPQSAKAGDYFLEVSAKSDKAETDSQEIRIYVQKKSGLSYVGIGLMAVSLLGLIIVYRKFGRR
jgi:uncharacterized membrane protein